MSEPKQGMSEKEANEALREISKGRMTIARAKSISKSALESGDEAKIRDAYVIISNEYNQKKNYCFHIMSALAKFGVYGAGTVILGLWNGVRTFYNEVESCKSTIDQLVANQARSETSTLARFADPPIQGAMELYNWATGSNNPIPTSPVGDILRGNVADTFSYAIHKLGYSGVASDKIADQIRDGVLTLNEATVDLCKALNRVSFSGIAENYLFTIILGLFVAYAITAFGVYFTVRVPKELTDMNFELMQKLGDGVFVKDKKASNPENLERGQPTGETPEARPPDATPQAEPQEVQNARQAENLGTAIRTFTPPRGKSNRSNNRRARL